MHFASLVFERLMAHQYSWFSGASGSAHHLGSTNTRFGQGMKLSSVVTPSRYGTDVAWSDLGPGGTKNRGSAHRAGGTHCSEDRARRAYAPVIKLPATIYSRTSAALPVKSMVGREMPGRHVRDLGVIEVERHEVGRRPDGDLGPLEPERPVTSVRHSHSERAGPSSPGTYKHVPAASPPGRATKWLSRASSNPGVRVGPEGPPARPAAGRKPSPRFASVLGQAHTLDPARPSGRSSHRRRASRG